MNVFPRQLAVFSNGMAAAFVAVAAQAQFDPLMQLGRIQGECLVRLPGVSDYEVGVESRAYPFGSEIRTREGSQVVVHFSPTVQLRLGPASAAVIAEADAGAGRALRVTLTDGVIGVYSPMDDADLPLVVRTPVADVDRIKGRVELNLVPEGEVHRLVVSTAIAELRLSGPQFRVERMGRNSSLEIQTAHDESYTGLTGKSGEYEVLVERGSEDPSIANFRPGSRVKIWRRRAALSGRLAVSVMIASGSGGAVKESFAFLQGETAVQEAVRGGGEEAEEAVPAETAADPSGALFDAIPAAVAPAAAAPAEAAGADAAAPQQGGLWDF